MMDKETELATQNNSEHVRQRTNSNQQKKNLKSILTSENNSNKCFVQLMANRTDKIMLVFVILLNPVIGLLRGSRSFKSIINNKACSTMDNLIIFSYIIIVGFLTLYNCSRLQKINNLTVKSDTQIDLGTKNIIKLLMGIFVVSLVGSLVSIPVFALYLIFSGISPFVASPTGMLLTTM